MNEWHDDRSMKEHIDEMSVPSHVHSNILQVTILPNVLISILQVLS